MPETPDGPGPEEKGVDSVSQAADRGIKELENMLAERAAETSDKAAGKPATEAPEAGPPPELVAQAQQEADHAAKAAREQIKDIPEVAEAKGQKGEAAAQVFQGVNELKSQFEGRTLDSGLTDEEARQFNQLAKNIGEAGLSPDEYKQVRETLGPLEQGLLSARSMSEQSGPAENPAKNSAEKSASVLNKPTAVERDEAGRQMAELQQPAGFVEPSHEERQRGEKVEAVPAGYEPGKIDRVLNGPPEPAAAAEKPERRAVYVPKSERPPRPRDGRTNFERLMDTYEQMQGPSPRAADRQPQPQQPEAQAESRLRGDLAPRRTELPAAERPEARPEAGAEAAPEARLGVDPSALRVARAQENAARHEWSSYKVDITNDDFPDQARQRRTELGVDEQPFYVKKFYGKGLRGLLRRIFRQPPREIERHYMNSGSPNSRHMEIMERSDGRTGLLLSQRTYTSREPIRGDGQRRRPARDVEFSVKQAREHDERMLKSRRA